MLELRTAASKNSRKIRFLARVSEFLVTAQRSDDKTEESSMIAEEHARKGKSGATERVTKRTQECKEEKASCNFENENFICRGNLILPMLENNIISTGIKIKYDTKIYSAVSLMLL